MNQRTPSAASFKMERPPTLWPTLDPYTAARFTYGARSRGGKMSGQQIDVNYFPDCDICRRAGRVRAASFYAKTRQGRWGYVCSRHFVGEGCVLGPGKGQKLVLSCNGFEPNS